MGTNNAQVMQDINSWMDVERIKPGNVKFVTQSECNDNLTICYHYVVDEIKG